MWLAWMDGFTQTVNYVDYLVEQKLFDRHNSTAIELIDKDVTKFHDYLRKNETVGVSVMSFFEDTVMKGPYVRLGVLIARGTLR
ncbi:hypothetical protein BKA69DRAFT_178218 [Paraphysoderma sedebokerense]|nr:hypothetical protein BKA69DRAFT_178218 [Paraphysoderma sedebokerense]